VPTAPETTDGPTPWSLAWQRAAFGPDGFYSAGAGARMWPHRFFRTSVHVGAVFHCAIATLLVEVDERLGHPDALDLVDVGAGRGELLPGVLDALPVDVVARVRAVAVDVHPAPDDLDPRVTWIVGAAPDAVPRGIRGLVVANEWLDDVPLDVVQLDDDLVARLVLVTRGGAETLGPRLDDDKAWSAWGLDAARARDWIDRWWPLTPEASAYPGDRAEIGVTRDDAWREVVARLDAGTALAIDYGHHLEHHRRASLTGYQLAGRVTAPVPDGSVNLTAHVAVDAVGEAVGTRKAVRRQHEALRALGVSATLPPSSLAAHDPSAYAEALQSASDAAELLDPSGLGAFAWIRLDR
jgi:SAM-dependent MidA family methyltransferase